MRSKPVNSFTMANRDNVDQIIVSACANAWIDNESFLVVSDNEKKLDELVKLASDVHEGLLIRACVEEDLARNPKRRCRSLSSLAKVLLDEQQAASSSIRQIVEKSYKELEEIEARRKESIEGAAYRKKWSDKKIHMEKARLEVAKRIWLHGLYPKGTDPMAIGTEATALENVSMFKAMRINMFMKKIGVNKPEATLADVIEWCNLSLHIKQADAEVAKYNDPDKYNVGAINYRWAASCISAVSASVSGALPGCSRTLSSLMEATERNDFTKKTVTSLIPHLRAWACDYYSVNKFFELSPGMFDVVVLDNAHHVNLSWALPVIYRAKRLVIIGDPSGVPPSVFLDNVQMNRIAERFSFDRGELAGRGLEYGSSNACKAFENA